MARRLPQPQEESPPERRWSAADIRRLQVHSSRLVTSIFAGEFRSTFRGRGIEFETVREYQPGDDVRCIDWNVTARSGRPFVKQFVEEREMTVMLLLDRSASLECPSPHGPKSRVAAEISALLAFSAVRSNDRIGLLTFSNHVDSFVPPGKGKRHAQRLIAEIVERPGSGGTGLAGALDYLQRVVRRPAIVFIISDFVCSDIQSPLASVARRHDVVAVAISDPHDLQIPEAGLLQVTDPETGRRRLIDTASAPVVQAFAGQAARRRNLLHQAVNAAGAELLTVSTTSPPVHAMIGFFQRRQRRLRG